MSPKPSKILHDSSYNMTAEPQPRNPYARLPSRRAIACVTCAKAKTKCNKAAPSCSRCITKGIICEPRSTRRTSVNIHHSNTRKTSHSLVKNHSLGALSRVDGPDSSQHLPPVGSNGDARRMSCNSQSVLESDLQTVSLPIHAESASIPMDAPYIIDESQLYMKDPERIMAGLDQAMWTSSISSLGGLSPPTPEPLVFHEPATMIHFADDISCPQTWYQEISASIEHGFGSSFSDITPSQMLAMRDDASTVPFTPSAPWPDSDYALLLPQTSSEPTSFYNTIGCYSGNQVLLRDWLPDSMPNWTMFEPTSPELTTVLSAQSNPILYFGLGANLVCEEAPCHQF
ncbi:hypothetical protein J3E72DRAFT_384587 [Bipolaris maydis]|nr:hypothetical protein J3E73DRAFT_380632 [Bipolaris maydis]KAJ6199167.1 hypothetical protein J3E72DRAFT_384587 [Bipolaris maydis]KAJ6203857.1 hypothetical protein PSV09DRAFT_2437847 [Bipolaris maydis]KAJ6265618.1 hypothetical protein PSV08DRAFT_366747 [Bipolaris maydis]KAJ6283425.1 hypothetical protein J3E71DRAFT_352069 [Bipolaris maydis]